MRAPPQEGRGCLPAVWPDLAKIHHFGKIVKVLGIILGVNLVLGNIVNLPTMPKYLIGQIFIFLNGQILTK